MSPSTRILIVEDDDIIANIISSMLERKGYGIAGRTGSGEKAIIKSADLEPDLVIMDISLCGEMDGVTAARFIFQLFHYPIIFLTAMCDDTLLDLAKGAQPLGFILKPFTDRELISNVELALYNQTIRKKHFDHFIVGEPKKIMGSFDAIIIMDITGRIIFFNPFAAWFLDLPEDEIHMKYWRDVMMLIHDQTDKQLKDPIPEVVRQKVVVTHEFNTAIVTKTSKRWKVSVTIRPLMDDADTLFGILMQIREKSSGPIKMGDTRPGTAL
ncbi:MAG: response regulator [Methanoregula sp.]|jgi:CheY-like chemotaxis protein|nr:response regulator [Methanoregula sp.]